MKKIFTLIIMVLAVALAMAQAPEKFTYQSVVRNASNALVANAPVGVRVSILQGGVNGTLVYMETQTAVTNANGLITLQIGGGSVQQGSFADIDWANGSYFLKTETDPAGGTNYSVTSTQQLLSVPYALYAKDAGNGFSGDYNDLTNLPQIPQIPANVSAFTNDVGYITMDSIPAIPTVPTNVSVFTNDAGYITGYTETDPTVPSWAKEATKPAYDYSEIANTPTIPTVPTNVSSFTNDAGYITTYTETDPQFNAWDKDYNDLTNKPALFSGNYNDLTNKPTLFDGNYNSLTNKPSLATVATTGNYNDLNNKPVLFSGNYNDLTNKPTIPTVPSNVSVFNNDAHYITEAQLNALLAVMNNTIDSLRDRIEELEQNPQTPSTGFPSLVTTAVSNVTGTSAQCGGNITADGGSNITERGVCWGVSPLPTVSGNHTSDGAGTGNFVSYLYGLQSGVTYYVRAYATNSTGTAYGNAVTFTTSTPTLDGNACPGMETVTDYDGNVYNTVAIGQQCWMKEDLRSTHYANGTAIASGSGTSSTIAYYYPVSGDFYNGNLYDWKAVMGGSSSSAASPSGVQGICPNGWHVPSDAEWTQLTNYVSSQSEYLCSNNTTYIAKALASTTGWGSSTNTCAVGNTQSSNNATGFGALPAGRYSSGGYVGSGYNAYFWSSTEASSGDAWYRYLYSSNASVYRYSDYKNIGYSVRCLRD